MAKEPWKYINSITNGKESLSKLPTFQSDYNPYLTNAALSYFQDTVMFANEINILGHLSKEMQYGFLFNAIRKRFRKGQKWFKTEVSDNEQMIAEYYNCNRTRAREYAAILNDEQLKKIKKELETGGKNEKFGVGKS